MCFLTLAISAQRLAPRCFASPWTVSVQQAPAKGRSASVGSRVQAGEGPIRLGSPRRRLPAARLKNVMKRLPHQPA